MTQPETTIVSEPPTPVDRPVWIHRPADGTYACSVRLDQFYVGSTEYEAHDWLFLDLGYTRPDLEVDLPFHVDTKFNDGTHIETDDRLWVGRIDQALRAARRQSC